MSFLAPLAGVAARAIGGRLLGGVASRAAAGIAGRIGGSALARGIGARGALSAAQFGTEIEAAAVAPEVAVASEVNTANRLANQMSKRNGGGGGGSNNDNQSNIPTPSSAPIQLGRDGMS